MWSNFDLRDLLVVELGLRRLAEWKSDASEDAKARARRMLKEILAERAERVKNARHRDQ
jgi:trimethylamine:corrinoid methyltransferase-like protein